MTEKYQTPFLKAVMAVVRMYGSEKKFKNEESYAITINHPEFLDLSVETFYENGRRLISVANILPKKGKIIEIIVDEYGTPIRYKAGGSQAIVHELNEAGEIVFVDSGAKLEVESFMEVWGLIIKNYLKKKIDPKPYKVYEATDLNTGELFRFSISTVRYASFIEEVKSGKRAIDLNSLKLIHETADRNLALEMVGHVEF